MRKFLSVFVPSNIRTAFILALQILMVLSIATRHPVVLALFVLCTGALILFEHNKIEFSQRYKSLAIFTMVSAAAVLPLNVFINPNVVFHFTILAGCLFSGFYAARKGIDYAEASKFLLILFQSYIFIYLYYKGTETQPLEDIVKDSSSNGITSYLVCLQINYSIAMMVIHRKVSIITSILTLWICVIGYGRGSIIAAAGIMLLNISFFAFSTKLLSVRMAIVLGSVAFVLYAAQNFGIIYDYVYSNTKIGSGLYDQERSIIIASYLERIDGLNLLTGVDIRGSIIDRFYNGNPHNSYIRAHMIFGLSYIVAIAVALIMALQKLPDFTTKAYCALAATMLLFRAATEPILFPTPFDFIFYALIALMMFANPADVKSAKQ